MLRIAKISIVAAVALTACTSGSDHHTARTHSTIGGLGQQGRSPAPPPATCTRKGFTLRFGAFASAGTLETDVELINRSGRDSTVAGAPVLQVFDSAVAQSREVQLPIAVMHTGPHRGSVSVTTNDGEGEYPGAEFHLQLGADTPNGTPIDLQHVGRLVVTLPSMSCTLPLPVQITIDVTKGKAMPVEVSDWTPAA